MRMSKMAVLGTALIFAGCASCGEDGTQTNNGTNNDTNNGTVAPQECTPEFQFEDWTVVEDRRLIEACSPYIVEDSIEVGEGATLTIDPGVEVQFAGSHWLRVGSGSPGALHAVGTAEDPIVLTSSQASPTPGSWLGVNIGADIESGTELSNVIVSYAGEDAFGMEACVHVEDGAREGTISLTDVTFENCLGGGLHSEADAFANISGLVFRESEGFGFSLAADALGSVAEAFTYENVTHNRIATQQVTASATWVAQPVPFRASDSIEVGGEDGPVLTLEPGVTLQFATDDWLRVASGVAGGLVAAGTAENPVVFEASANAPAAGAWLGLNFQEDLLAETSLDHVVVRHAGADAFGTRGCVTIDTPAAGRISITNSVFEDCAGAGVSARGVDFGFASFSANTFRNLAHGLDLPPNAVNTVADAQTYEGVPANRIEGGEYTESGTWVAQPIPWNVADSIEVRGESGPVLTLEAGNVIQFIGMEFLRVGSGAAGALVAMGTAESPVVFQSSADAPAVGDWLGLRFADSTAAGTVLDFVEVRHGGADGFGTLGCVTIDTVPVGRIAVSNSTFGPCLQAGVSAQSAAFQFQTFSANTFEDSPYGLDLAPDGVSSVADGQTYTNVAANRLTGDIATQSGTWVTQSVPWDVFDSIEIGHDNQPVITIEAGNTFRFETSEWVRVGSGVPGGLVVNGTAAAPVVFTSRDPAPAAGSWLGLRFESDALNGTLLNEVEVEYAGQDSFGQNGAAHIGTPGARVSITNSTFSNNLQADIFVEIGATPVLVNNSATVVID